jgi:hypothetical protein
LALTLAEPGTLIVTMGAGDVTSVAHHLADELDVSMSAV